MKKLIIKKKSEKQKESQANLFQPKSLRSLASRKFSRSVSPSSSRIPDSISNLNINQMNGIWKKSPMKSVMTYHAFINGMQLILFRLCL